MATDDVGRRWRRLWMRFADWLGLDRSPPTDLLSVDPVSHFKHWDRDLPDRYWG